MPRLRPLCIALVLSLACVLPTTAWAESEVTASAGAQRSMDSYRFFDPTGHSVSGPFLTFFDANGGLDVFGYPLTEAFEENGQVVQYFQRHRMELWPENPANWRVQLALIGDLVLGPAEPPVPPPADPAIAYFPETGHAVGPPFRQFFETRGGKLIFGYPTSEAYQEGAYLVQRFQRARLEYRPENPPAYRVQPGLLGAQYVFQARLVAEELTRPVAAEAGDGWFVWGAWTTDMHDFLPFKVTNNTVAAGAIDGAVLKPGQAFSFNRVLYAQGYVDGLGYGPDNQYTWMRAGGVCASATGLYRAAYNAGLQIVEAHPHTLASYPPYGWDATVQEGGVDLVIRNDAGIDLRLRASVNLEDGQLTYWVEGRQPPDRSIRRDGPRRTGDLAYVVSRTITYADGRQLTEKRTIRYAGYPPPLPPLTR